VKVFSFMEKKKKKMERNLDHFQDRFWEWVFTCRWNPCPQCTKMIMHLWGQECLWHKLCPSCQSYFYHYQLLYVRAIKGVCNGGEKVPTFRELEEWYFETMSP